MNIAILTSNQPRHKAFISTISSLVYPSLVVVESKLPTTFVNREELFFKRKIKDLNLNFFKVDKGKINSDEVAKLLIERKIDIIFVFGTSILKDNIFSIPKFCINIHTGLVQEYRGVDSNFWALYEKNIEAIGVTIHKINAGIDTGDVLMQKRIELSPDDSIDSIFLKSCAAGFELIENNIDRILNEKINQIKMKKRGKLFKIKNMNNEAILKVKATMKENIQDYLEDKVNRNKRVKIINGVD